MTQSPDKPTGEWFELTYRTYIQVTDRTAVAAAAFDRIRDPVTGEESMMTWPEQVPNMQLQTFLTRILTMTLEQLGEEGAGFTWRITANAQLDPMDPPEGA
jgi:hypothetical protein